MQTLVLDQGYEPQRIVSWQRAVGMLFVGKAEIVHDYAESIHSVSMSMKMPAVVRMTRAGRGRKRDIRLSRAHVFLRDGYRCQYCGEVKERKLLTCDHVLPRSRGGASSWENLVTACAPCNFAKASRTPSEAGLTLLRRPVKPRWLMPLHAVRTAPGMPEAWQLFLRPVST